MSPETASAQRDAELSYFTATELARSYRSRALSPLEVTRAVLNRIERLEPDINAFVLVDGELALDAARASEARFQRGAAFSELDGVTVSLKDLLLTRGWPTRCGSHTTAAEGPWLEDSPAAARLREAGAVLLGKTTTSEFGLKGMGDSPLTGITRNPRNLEHSPGGSSAGAVAAVAAGLGALAVGTDGGGSIRVPAAFAGVIGLKPSYGRVPTYPASVIGAPPHVGPIARCVADAASLLNVLARPDDRDPFRLPVAAGLALESADVALAGTRIGYSATLGYAQPDPEILLAFDRAVSVFAELGAELSEFHAPDLAPGAILTILFNARAAFTVCELTHQQRQLLDPAIEAAARAGEALGLIEYLSAESARSALATRYAELHRKFDLLLTPATGETAPNVYAAPSPRRAPFTGAFSLTRQPAISLPNGLSRAGLPIGLQIVGRHFDEARVLRAAAAFEARVRFEQPPPWRSRPAKAAANQESTSGPSS